MYLGFVPLFHSYFRPVSAIRGTELLKAFRDFALHFNWGARPQDPQSQRLQRIYTPLHILTKWRKKVNLLLKIDIFIYASLPRNFIVRLPLPPIIVAEIVGARIGF